MTCNNCGVENSNDAKFCSKCGKIIMLIVPIKPIKWINTNLVKAKPKWWWYLINSLLGIAIGFSSIMVGGLIDQWRDRNLPLLLLFIVLDAVFIFLLCFLIVLKNKKIQKLRRVAAAMEDNYSDEKLLIKDGKYGLYNWKHKEVLLPVIYDNIYRHETYYYTVKYRNKYGIYEIFSTYFKIIVPIEYDAVTPFVNGVASITKDNVTKQVDTDGNIF